MTARKFGGAQPGAGRPPLPPGEARTIKIGIPVNERERDLLRRASEVDGYSIAEQGRYALLHHACEMLGLDWDEWWHMGEERPAKP